MVTLIGMAVRPMRENIEPIDRDPGIVALSARIVRSFRGLAQHLRAAHQRANEAELFSSSSAWPYNHRYR